MKSIVVLSNMPYAQAKVIRYMDGSVSLVSYATEVASITAAGWLTVYGLHSQTTRKHFGAFMKEYANACYQTAKAAYENHSRYNIHTGEIEPL